MRLTSFNRYMAGKVTSGLTNWRSKVALKDIIAKLSPDNEKLFHHDPEAQRRPVLERIAKNREAFADPSKKVRGGRWKRSATTRWWPSPRPAPTGSRS